MSSPQCSHDFPLDRGMVSENNLKFLRQRGGSYIVGTPKAMLRRFEQYLTEKDWYEVQAAADNSPPTRRSSRSNSAGGAR